MIGNGLFELAVDLDRFVLVAIAREEAAIGFDVAHRDCVRLVGALVALGGIFFVVGEIEDQSGMHVLEDRVPVRSGEPVERVDCRMRIAGAGIGPSREQGGGEIGDRTADRLREILPCQRILLLLERAHAEHKPRDPIAAVDLHQTIGQAAGLLDIAFGEHGEEGAAEQLRIARIGLQHVEVISGRGRRNRARCRHAGPRDSCPRRSHARGPVSSVFPSRARIAARTAWRRRQRRRGAAAAC